MAFDHANSLEPQETERNFDTRHAPESNPNDYRPGHDSSAGDSTPPQDSRQSADRHLRLVADTFEELFESVEEEQWQDRALCAQTDPEAFFPEKGGSTREAKRICQGCEVRSECLEYALAKDERFGIWGGLSERERRRLKRGII